MLVDPADTRLLWLLLRTKPKQEAAVVRTLGGRSFEAYCPRVLEPRRHVRAPRGPVPLFPAYVFARCVPRDSFAAVNYCTGAAGVVRFGAHVAAVEEGFIAALREREGTLGYLVMSDVRREPRQGSRVRIVRGMLEGFEGIVERYLPARDRVRLLLQLVAGTRPVEVDATDVQTT